jgi:hypothetical protein
MFEWFFQIIIVWFGVSIAVIATGWYLAAVIPAFWPEWWKQVVVDIEPDNRVHHYK